MLTANEIRRKFLDYFVSKGHTEVASAPLIPKDDATLLFTNAGMVQFKRVFLGQEKRDYNRATTSQKCLRVGGKHNDLENVGRTARHHTFFEMLGNFSFGDYFKKEAIAFAWEFLTEEIGLDKNRMYATVYLDDDEAYDLWREVANLPEERIFRLGDKDNFWSMGDTGPCGPCSELHYDQGEDMACGENCGIGKCDCDRFLEVWNLVFMQYDQIDADTRIPLPRPSIDTGMGLERIAAVCQGVQSNYEIDLFQDLIHFTESKAGVSFADGDEEIKTAFRVIADHSRAIAFMIADGILPSNESRGYVLRRLIRRAYRFGRLIGFNAPFLFDTADYVVSSMGHAFPELEENRDFMKRVVREEEERFSQTLDKGLVMLEEELASLKEQGRTQVSGEFAFKLYDTYGFPVDIINDVAEKHGLGVDEPGYNARMAEQKERAKAAWKGSGEVDLGSRFHALLEEGVGSEFVGYDTMQCDSIVEVLLNAAAEQVESLPEGAEGYVVCPKTPFYGESGGQLGDTGVILTSSGKAEVGDALKPAASLIVHQIKVLSGELHAGQDAKLEVTEGERLATERNHTATHLLHAALRKVLGDHVKQAGSLVGPDRLRFDFTHISAMTQDELEAVEREVNAAVLQSLDLKVEHMAYDAAVARGAMALFGEKYEAEVRVVEVPGVSIELCGGTHLRNTGQIGSLLILSESGVAAGVRRIEAATGWNTFELVQQLRRDQAEVGMLLKAKPDEVVGKLKHLQSESKKLAKEVDRLAAKAASAKGGGIMDGLEEISGIKTLAVQVDAPNVKALRDLMDDVRSKLPSGVACLAAVNGDKVPLILYVSKDLHERFTAPQLIKDVATEIGGSGGGRPDLAQAGGTNPAGVSAAFAKLKELLAG